MKKTMKKITINFIGLIFFISQPTIAKGEDIMKIKVTAVGMNIIATLNNTSTAKDLMKQLPLKIKMQNHQKREYYGSIKLSTNTPTQDGYEIGDIAYWEPGNAFVLFYDKGYTDDLIIMGKITSGLNELSNMENSFDAKIEEVNQ